MRRFHVMVAIAALFAWLAWLPVAAFAQPHVQVADERAELRVVTEKLDAARTRVVRLHRASAVIAGQMSEERLRSPSVETTFFKELALELPRVRDRARAARRTVERLRQTARRLRSDISFRRSLLFPSCPVDQPLEFVDDFGVMSVRDGLHVHQGIDMHAPYGTPIRAPFDGTADIATNGPGGLAVRVLGSKGFVYNAHLSALGKLGPVRAGEIIGYVGNSGDARFTQPHDHFEWHPGGGGAVDPYPDLVSSCG